MDRRLPYTLGTIVIFVTEKVLEDLIAKARRETTVLVAGVIGATKTDFVFLTVFVGFALRWFWNTLLLFITIIGCFAILIRGAVFLSLTRRILSFCVASRLKKDTDLTVLHRHTDLIRQTIVNRLAFGVLFRLAAMGQEDAIETEEHERQDILSEQNKPHFDFRTSTD